MGNTIAEIRLKQNDADRFVKETGSLGKLAFKRVGGANGLMVRVTAKGKASWVLRYQIGQQMNHNAAKRRDLKLGEYNDLSIAQARLKASDLLRETLDGYDPLAEREKRKKEQIDYVSFAAAFEKVYELKQQELSNAKHVAQWKNTMEKYVLPFIGSQDIRHLTVDDVLRILEQPVHDKNGKPIKKEDNRTALTFWHGKTETADRVRQRMESVFGWAIATGNRTDANPAIWTNNLEWRLPKVSAIKKSRKQPRFDIKELPYWFAEMNKLNGNAAKCLCLVAITASRTGTVRNARWDQFDFEKKVWVAPADNMKGLADKRREHTMPLGDRAVRFLEALQEEQEICAPFDSTLLFPSPSNGFEPISDNFTKPLQVVNNRHPNGGYRDPKQPEFFAVPHGIRATFSMWAAEQGYEPLIFEQQLAHNVGSEVFRAYMRSDLLDRRRAMMDEWEKHLFSVIDG